MWICAMICLSVGDGLVFSIVQLLWWVRSIWCIQCMCACYVDAWMPLLQWVESCSGFCIVFLHLWADGDFDRVRKLRYNNVFKQRKVSYFYLKYWTYLFTICILVWFGWKKWMSWSYERTWLVQFNRYAMPERYVQTWLKFGCCVSYVCVCVWCVYGKGSFKMDTKEPHRSVGKIVK